MFTLSSGEGRSRESYTRALTSASSTFGGVSAVLCWSFEARILCICIARKTSVIMHTWPITDTKVPNTPHRRKGISAPAPTARAKGMTPGPQIRMLPYMHAASAARMARDGARCVDRRWGRAAAASPSCSSMLSRTPLRCSRGTETVRACPNNLRTNAIPKIPTVPPTIDKGRHVKYGGE